MSAAPILSLASLDEPPVEPTEQHVVNSWAPVDLGPILDGGYEPPMPTIGARADGVGMFYPGRLHSIVAEPEAGKTWFALIVLIYEMERGNDVAFIDFEDEPAATVDRLLTLGCSRETLRKHFRYIRPTGPVDLATLLPEVDNCTIVIIDGVTEAMALHGLSPLDNAEVARFWKLLPRAIAAVGPAVAMLDHVVKSTESRGRWAIGGQHKLAGLNGAQYMLERVHPFGHGMRGVSRVTVAKDRPGQIRPHTLRMSGGADWFADLVLDGTDGPLVGELVAPQERAGEVRPTALMVKVCEALQRAGTPLTSNDILDRVTGKAVWVRKALAALVDEGYVSVETGPRNARLHLLVKPFTDD